MTGPFARPDHDQVGLVGLATVDDTDPFRQRQERYTARHATPRRKTTRWVGKAAPAAAIAATLAAGAVAYGFFSDQSGTGKVATALNLPVSVGAVAEASLGSADAATAKVSGAKTGSRAPRATHASARPSPSRPAPSATAQPTAAQPAAPAQPVQAAAAPPSSAGTGGGSVSCSDAGLLPDNVTAIVNFLLSNGYSDNAAAGIAGNIYQESKGDPESVGSGGGGLIGWTPLPSGFVTGDPAADLQTQLSAILTYNNGWSAYIPALNSAATPADAADIYVSDFERAGIPAAGTREASAEDVASACGI
jgi:hypothetical protein